MMDQEKQLQIEMGKPMSQIQLIPEVAVGTLLIEDMTGSDVEKDVITKMVLENQKMSGPVSSLKLTSVLESNKSKRNNKL